MLNSIESIRRQICDASFASFKYKGTNDLQKGIEAGLLKEMLRFKQDEEK